MTMSSNKPDEMPLKWFEKLTKSGNDKLNKTHYLIILGIFRDRPHAIQQCIQK